MSDDLYETPQDKTYGDTELEPGVLLTGSDKKVAEANLKLWTSKDDLFSKREAQWKVNELRRAGIKNVQLRQETDDRSWNAWVPPYNEKTPDAVTAMNKAASLCRTFVSMIHADPPGPQAVPASGEDEDRDAAEFSTRVLEDIQSEARLNTPKTARRAFDRASTFGSGFVRYYVHPTAGGRLPIQISAGIGATSVQDAARNPLTGADWAAYREVYVKRDGTLTDDVSEAAFKFLPEIKCEVLTGRNVRLIPHTAEDVWEAEGCQVAAFRPYGEVKKQFDLKLSEEDEATLFQFKPKNWKHLASTEEKRALKRNIEDPDERLVFTLTTYYKACSEYPRGVCVVTLGDEHVLEKRDWTETDSEGREISLSIPLTQHKQWSEGTDNPYGFGMMDLVGEGNEIRAHMIGSFMDHIDHLLNKKIFLPIHSTVRDEDLRLPGKSVIRTLPGGEPKYEDVDAFPADGIKLIDLASKEMEDDTKLGQVAQGLESAQVQSGRHAQAILAQVHSGLSEIRQNVIDGYTRSCRIQLELVRAFYDTPRRIGYVGEDGAYKERRWTGADLRATSDVKLRPGSLTMLSPIQKASLAQQYMQSGVITQEDLRDITASELGGTLGLQDDRFVMRIRRQVAAWLEGPPEGWAPQFGDQPVLDQNGQQVLDQFGQPQTEQVQIMDPDLGAIWNPLPVDDLPYVARTRLRELGKLMCSTEFMAKPQEWQFAPLQEFNRANMAQTGTPGMQVGQPPNVQQSPAQRTQGPLAPPETPVPDGMGKGTLTP